MSSVIQPHDAQVVLSDVDWETYARLREAVGNRNIRMTYDHGCLELMSPSKLHERISELLGRLILAWTEEHDIAVQSCGSMTFKRQDLQKGFEPDKCYYIRHEPAVRDHEELDLTIDPPPDLAVEVDVAATSAGRMPLYAAIGVPEVWRWKEDSLQVFALSRRRRYLARNHSVCLPGFPIAEAARLLGLRHAMNETALIRLFRQGLSA